MHKKCKNFIKLHYLFESFFNKILTMKKLLFLLVTLVFVVACNENKKETEAVVEEIAQSYKSFGDKINDAGTISSEEMAGRFKNLKAGDTIDVKFSSKVNAVCQSKGCWMRVDVKGEEAMVKFKDYGFFMPKDIAGQEVIMNGKAFVEEVSVDEQRHYAEDAGKSEEEIAAITEPKRTLSFVSDGVLIPDASVTPEKH